MDNAQKIIQAFQNKYNNMSPAERDTYLEQMGLKYQKDPDNVYYFDMDAFLTGRELKYQEDTDDVYVNSGWEVVYASSKVDLDSSLILDVDAGESVDVGDVNVLERMLLNSFRPDKNKSYAVAKRQGFAKRD